LDAQELHRTIVALKTLRKMLEESPEKARAFLEQMGLVTHEGELTEAYRQPEEVTAS
jgi:hypothetical protein